VGLLVQELEDPGVFEVYRQLSSNAGGSQIYISRTQMGNWDGDIKQLTLRKIKIAVINLDLPAEIVGIKRDSNGQLLLNPANAEQILPTDRLVYVAKKRFDWQKKSAEILKTSV
jgi:hypothetical protein